MIPSEQQASLPPRVWVRACEIRDPSEGRHGVFAFNKPREHACANDVPEVPYIPEALAKEREKAARVEGRAELAREVATNLLNRPVDGWQSIIGWLRYIEKQARPHLPSRPEQGSGGGTGCVRR